MRGVLAFSILLTAGVSHADELAVSVTNTPPPPTEIVYTEPVPTEPTFAEPALTSSVLLDAPSIPRRMSLARRVVDNLTVLGDELGLHLSALTGDLVRLDFDFAKKQGRFKLGGGDGGSFLLRLDGDVEVHGSVARIRSRLDLGIGGESLRIDLPEMDLATQTVQGERAVELRVPLIEGKF